MNSTYSSRSKHFRRGKTFGIFSEEVDPRDELTPLPFQRLRLQVVYPGRYISWACTGGSAESSGLQNMWELKKQESSTTTFDSGAVEVDQADEVDDDSAEHEDNSSTGRRGSRKYDDPMLNVMWKEVQAERQVSALIDFKLEQDRKAWATSSYKLTSLEGKGESELIRLLFVNASEPYEDERISVEHWEEMKTSTLYHNLPILSKCGKTWGDTGAIVRVLARRFLTMGVSNDEHLVVEATYERLRRLKRQNERAINWVITGEKNKEKQEWAQSQLLHVVLPPAMKEWEELVTKTPGPFVVASGMTMADLAIMDFLDQCSSSMMIDSLFSDHLAVADLYSMVRLRPKIVEYLEKRSED